MVQRFFRQVEAGIYTARHIGGLLGVNSPRSARDIEAELERRQQGGRNTVADVISRDAAASRRTLAEQTPVDGQLTVQPTSKLVTSYDWRARLRPKGSFSDNPYWAGPVLAPLRETGGLVFQYTPQIFVSHTADWNQTHGVGQNYPIYTYSKSNIGQITVQCDFTANTVAEARYMLAVLHFARVITKAFYGENAAANNAGQPPPVLEFEYLGEHSSFRRVPVIVAGVTYNLTNEVDYVPVTVGDDVTFVPVETAINFTLQPSYTPDSLRKQFSLEDLVRGEPAQRRFG
jgi:hypothetical protein